jgi:hypothetical protein
MKTTLFESKPPYPPVRFEYPEDWKTVLSSGKGYKDITIIGPRNVDDTFSLALVVRFTQLASPGVDLKHIMDDTIGRKSKLRDFEVTSRSDLEIAKHKGESIDFRYSTLKSLKKLDSGQMKVCEKRIIFLDGDTQYEIIYSATEESYEKYYDVAGKIIQSLQVH